MSEKIEKMAMKTIIKDKLNPTIDRILEEPTTEYLPNVSLQPKYDFQIFQTHSKRKGKRTLSKLLYDLQETDPRYTKIDSDSDNPEPRKYVEIMDVDEFSPNEENEATVEALKTLNFDIDPKFKKVLKLHQVKIQNQAHVLFFFFFTNEYLGGRSAIYVGSSLCSQRRLFIGSFNGSWQIHSNNCFT